MMRKRAALLCVVLLGAACTGSSSGADPSGSASPSVAAADQTSSPSASPTPPVFGPNDDVLNVAVSEPATLDPMRIQDPGSMLIARQLYEGLTAWEPESQEVVPAAAGSWEVTNGGRTFTFAITQGQTFHDGTPITSRDFAYAFDRIAQKDNASAIAYTLERVDGFDEVNGTGDADSLSGIQTPDDYTLVVKLVEPYMEFPYVLTHPGLVPVQRAQVEQPATFLSTPVGNGPFQIAEPWAPGAPVVLKRFDGFVRTSALEGIRFVPFPDAATSWLRFVGGEYDLAEVPAGQVEAARKSFGDDGYVPFLATYNFGFNLDSPGLKDVRLREAVSKAIDREAIAERVYKGTMGPPRGIVPSGVPGFTKDVCGDLCRYLPDQARALVGKLPKGDRSITIDYTKGAPHDRVAKMVAKDLEAVGFDVQTKGYEFGDYVERLKRGEQAIYRLGWIAEYPSPDAFLGALFRSDSPDNHGGFSSNEVDRILARAHAESNVARRTALYRKAEKLILRSVPIVPIGSFVTNWAAQSYVKDLAVDVTGGFDAVGIDLQEK